MSLRPLTVRFAAAFVLTGLAASPAAAQSFDLPRELPNDPPSGYVTLDPRLPRAPSAVVIAGSYVSVQVNVDAVGNNVVGDAANEPSLAVNPANPDNLVVGWRQFDSITSDFREAGRAFSFDAGSSWNFPGVIDDGVFRSDPVLAADNAGTIFYQSLYRDAQGDIRNQVFRSFDGGLSFGPPVEAWGGDKNWITVDNTNGPGAGFLYGTWQPFFDCCNGDTLTRSIDAGASYQVPVEIDRRPLFGTVTVAGDGTLYIAGVEGDFGQDFETFVVSRSADAQNAGVSPSSSGVVVDMGGAMALSLDPNPSGLLGQAVVATDASGGPHDGNVYLLATVDPAGAFESGPTEVRFSRSTDGGVTWSPSVRVHDDLPGNGAWHWFGNMDVSPNGRIDVIWYDTRDTGLANESELYYAWSWDGGATWLGNVAASPAFDTHLGWPQQAKIGDYTGIASDETGCHLAYAATHNGEQDVWHVRLFPDCDGNGVSDVTDIASGAATDCNQNHVPDACDIADGTSTDGNGNGVPDECEAAFTDLGNGLSGTAGVPSLSGSGLLLGGDPIVLTLADGAPTAPAALVLGASTLFAPFKGGILVPAADLVFAGFFTSPGGALSFAGTWPTGLPSGTQLAYQIWITDAAGPVGYAASNGLLSTSP
ncbi:MAG: sialidase family protein [Planctomycetota bacterium]|jgi:hypothetical protein